MTSDDLELEKALHAIDVDNLGRVDSLAKTVYLLAGGTLSITVGLVLKDGGGPELGCFKTVAVLAGWVLLLVSMVLMTVAQGTLG